MKKTTLLSLVCATLLPLLQADESVGLGSVVVEAANGVTQKQKDVSDDVIVITKEELEQNRITSLDEALNKLGNLFMTNNGGPGKSTSFFLRGMDNKRVLVLIDGVRYNNPTAIGAAAEYSKIMLFDVERIEIIKGAQSGVWGSDASGGVINIVTSKTKKGFSAAGSIEQGAYNTTFAKAKVGYGDKRYDVTLAASYYNTDGYSAVEPTKSDPNYGKRYDDLGLEKDGYKNKSVRLKVGYNITQKDRIEASWNRIDSKLYYDSFAGVAGDSPIPNQTVTNNFYSIVLKHKDSLNDIKLRYNLSTFDREEVGTWGSSTYKGSTQEIKLDDTISYRDASFVRVGASYSEFKQEDITPNTTKSYKATSFFVTNSNIFATFAKNKLVLTESLRYDNYDAFDDALTGKLGAKQFVYHDYYISANIATGYNAPTLNELYGQYGANPNLKPEKSLTSDVTVGNNIFWITAFYNEITDLIEYDLNTWQYVQTSGTSKFIGAEAGFEDYFYHDMFGVKLLYTYVKTKDANGDSLARRPKQQADAFLSYYLAQKFEATLHGQYVGKRYDKKAEQGAQTGDYFIADLTLNDKVTKNLTLYAKIQNLTDKYYQTVDGYATAARSVYVGMSLKY